MIYRLATTTSTNDEARDARYRHGDVVWAERQTAGRGQRGHVWHSPEGENLTFSLVLEPQFLPIGEQFLLSEAVALALTDMFAHYGIATRIKWTNDIYAGNRKIVGMLIEHNCSGPTLARSIVGIGINVNQAAFDPALPNPVSMAQLTGRTFDREEVLRTFLERFALRYEQLRQATGKPCKPTTAPACTGWANGTPTACQGRARPRASSKEYAPPGNCLSTTPTERSANTCSERSNSC